MEADPNIHVLNYAIVIKAFIIFSACIVKYFKVKNSDFKAQSFFLPTHRLCVVYEK